MTAGLGLRLLPQPFEPMPGNPGVMSGVLGIAVAEFSKSSHLSPHNGTPRGRCLGGNLREPAFLHFQGRSW